MHTPIHFGFDQARIETDQQPLLDRLSEVPKEYYPEALLTVEGFTDPAGSPSYNLRLGQRSANEARAYLLTQGWLAEPQIRAVSYGEDTGRLILPDAWGPADGMENRRVVIVIDHPNTWPAAKVTMTTSTAGTN